MTSQEICNGPKMAFATLKSQVVKVSIHMFDVSHGSIKRRTKNDVCPHSNPNKIKPTTTQVRISELTGETLAWALSLQQSAWQHQGEERGAWHHIQGDCSPFWRTCSMAPEAPTRSSAKKPLLLSAQKKAGTTIKLRHV